MVGIVGFGWWGVGGVYLMCFGCGSGVFGVLWEVVVLINLWSCGCSCWFYNECFFWLMFCYCCGD